jgi:uncharacterized membrane protein YfcA
LKLLSAIGPFSLAGLAAGAVAGLFGVGGGILMVPVLVLAFSREQHLAQGTSLAAMVPLAIAGALRYSVKGNVDWIAAAGLAIGAVIGVTYVGVPLAEAIKAPLLGKLFGVLMTFVGLRMVGVFDILYQLVHSSNTPG